ncbi:MAG: AraC family transcriptional regulator, partial [Eubacteriales bacterium]
YPPVAVNPIVRVPRRSGMPRHAHTYVELYYNTDGTSVIKLDYNRRISVDKDQWVLIGQNVCHEEIVYGRCSGYLLGIETDPAGLALLTGLQSAGCLTGREPRQMGAILTQVWQEQTERSPGYAQCCGHLLSLLLLSLFRWCNAGWTGMPGKEEPERVRAAIDGFFGRVYRCETVELTPEYLAEQLHVSTRHLNRLLQKYYGMNFQQLLLSNRMQFAEYLLSQSEKSVSEICEMCGLSETYLIRCFKEHYGMTPAQYRRRKINGTG